MEGSSLSSGTAEVVVYVMNHLPGIWAVGMFSFMIAGFLAYFIAKTFTEWRKGRREAEKDLSDTKTEIIETKDVHIDALTGSIDLLTTKVSNLESQVKRLSNWFEHVACLNAPTCPRRSCPDRQSMALMAEGLISPEDIINRKREAE